MALVNSPPAVPPETIARGIERCAPRQVRRCAPRQIKRCAGEPHLVWAAFTDAPVKGTYGVWTTGCSVSATVWPGSPTGSAPNIGLMGAWFRSSRYVGLPHHGNDPPYEELPCGLFASRDIQGGGSADCVSFGYETYIPPGSGEEEPRRTIVGNLSFSVWFERYVRPANWQDYGSDYADQCCYDTNVGSNFSVHNPYDGSWYNWAQAVIVDEGEDPFRHIGVLLVKVYMLDWDDESDFERPITIQQFLNARKIVTWNRVTSTIIRAGKMPLGSAVPPEAQVVSGTRFETPLFVPAGGICEEISPILFRDSADLYPNSTTNGYNCRHPDSTIVCASHVNWLNEQGECDDRGYNQVWPVDGPLQEFQITFTG